MEHQAEPPGQGSAPLRGAGECYVPQRGEQRGCAQVCRGLRKAAELTPGLGIEEGGREAGSGRPSSAFTCTGDHRP